MLPTTPLIECLPRLIGHRGAAASAPENTLAGLRKAHADGATWVEFDVKLTADGVPILMHDDRLGRTTNGEGRVAETAADMIATLDAGGWFGAEFAGELVPTLRAALELAAELGLGINIELKPCPGRAKETADVALTMVGEVWPDTLPEPLVSSFDQTALAAARAIKPNLPRGFLCTRVPRNWPALLERFACQTLNVSNRWISSKHIERALAVDVPVLVYTVNDPKRARKLLSAGVTSIFTDEVGKMVDVAKARSAAADLVADRAEKRLRA